MRVGRVRVLGVRNLRSGELALGELTLLWGANGAGKTSVVEAVCLALAGRSCRTRREREVIAFGADLARIEAEVTAGGETRTFLWSAARSGERRHQVDGSAHGPEHAGLRPRLGIFLPDRLALVKGPPGQRRDHLDRLVTGLWPGRASARRRYAAALAQRNALLARVRAGAVAADSLDAWDAELAGAGVELIAARAEAATLIAPQFADAAADLGLGGGSLAYRPRSRAGDAAALAAELGEKRTLDVARGYTSHGPHLDELALELDGRSLRRYGSQGEQRTGLLALLLAERRLLVDAGREPPLMLLDDVMSELDERRRLLLAERLSEGGGQAVVTATDRAHLPRGPERIEIALRDGAMITAAGAGAAAA